VLLQGKAAKTTMPQAEKWIHVSEQKVLDLLGYSMRPLIAMERDDDCDCDCDDTTATTKGTE
jgi:hypothetical protein